MFSPVRHHDTSLHAEKYLKHMAFRSETNCFTTLSLDELIRQRLVPSKDIDSGEGSLLRKASPRPSKGMTGDP